MPYLAILKWFLGPIGKWVLIAIAALAIIGGGLAYVSHRVHVHDAAIVQAEKDKAELAATKQAAIDAAADLAAQEAREAQNQAIALQARQELATALSAQAGRVAPVRAQVASHELPTAAADPTILAYVKSTKEPTK